MSPVFCSLSTADSWPSTPRPFDGPSNRRTRWQRHFRPGRYRPIAPESHLGLTVLATVVSKKEDDPLVVEAGMKAISVERCLPSIKDAEGMQLIALHAEHGIVRTSGPKPPVNVGDQPELWVAHSDATVYLHREMYRVRNGIVEEVFKIEF